MSECKTILGRLFGHKWEPKFTVYREPTRLSWDGLRVVSWGKPKRTSDDWRCSRCETVVASALPPRLLILREENE